MLIISKYVKQTIHLQRCIGHKSYKWRARQIINGHPCILPTSFIASLSQYKDMATKNSNTRYASTLLIPAQNIKQFQINYV